MLALLAVPPLVSAVLPADTRPLEGVRLDEVTYSEVRFTNDDQDLELGGMLFEPEGEGPFPAAVIIHGSGTSHRDNGCFEDRATGTEAAISYMRTQAEVPVRSVGVVGVSQGGRIAPMVASRDPDVAWAMNVVGDAVLAHEAMRYEETHNLRETTNDWSDG